MKTYPERLLSTMMAKHPPVARESLAGAMGISVQALGNLLRGEVKKIDLEKARKAAEFLGVTLADLTGSVVDTKPIQLEDAATIPLPPLQRFVDYRAVRMSALDYNKLLFDFRKSLPAQYRRCAGLAHGMPPHLRAVYFDYRSQHLTAMVIPVNGASVGKSISDSVLELVLARHAEERNTELVLLFIDPFGSQVVNMPPAAHDACDLLGINIITVKTPEEAAQYITDIEDDIKQYLADD